MFSDDKCDHRNTRGSIILSEEYFDEEENTLNSLTYCERVFKANSYTHKAIRSIEDIGPWDHHKKNLLTAGNVKPERPRTRSINKSFNSPVSPKTEVVQRTNNSPSTEKTLFLQAIDRLASSKRAKLKISRPKRPRRDENHNSIDSKSRDVDSTAATLTYKPRKPKPIDFLLKSPGSSGSRKSKVMINRISYEQSSGHHADSSGISKILGSLTTEQDQMSFDAQFFTKEKNENNVNASHTRFLESNEKAQDSLKKSLSISSPFTSQTYGNYLEQTCLSPMDDVAKLKLLIKGQANSSVNSHASRIENQAQHQANNTDQGSQDQYHLQSSFNLFYSSSPLHISNSLQQNSPINDISLGSPLNQSCIQASLPKIQVSGDVKKRISLVEGKKTELENYIEKYRGSLGGRRQTTAFLYNRMNEIRVPKAKQVEGNESVTKELGSLKQALRKYSKVKNEEPPPPEHKIMQEKDTLFAQNSYSYVFPVYGAANGKHPLNSQLQITPSAPAYSSPVNGRPISQQTPTKKHLAGVFPSNNSNAHKDKDTTTKTAKNIQNILNGLDVLVHPPPQSNQDKINRKGKSIVSINKETMSALAETHAAKQGEQRITPANNPDILSFKISKRNRSPHINVS